MSKALKTAKDVALSPVRFGALESQAMGDKLPFDYQLPMLSKDFHKLPRMSKLNAILDLPEPEQFVRHLPAQEVHHLVHHIGIEDAAVLVPHTTPEQFQSLLDLDLWNGSEFQATRFERWLWALDEYGDSSELSKRVWNIDMETTISILMQWTRIHLIEGEDDPPTFPDSSQVFTSPDMRFQIEVFGENAEKHFPTAFRLIHALYENQDLDEVHALLDRVCSELPNEVEEDLLKFRNARLEDIGFLPMEEALTMYAYNDPAEVKGRLHEMLAEIPQSIFSHEGAPMGTSLMALGTTDNFLSEVLASIGDRNEQERFIISFSYLCNRAYCVRTIDLSDIDALNEESRTVFGRLNIAVEYLSGGNLESASLIVRHLHLVELHRVGASLCEKLGRQARWILRTLGHGDARHLFDAPFDEILSANARMHPEFPEMLADSTSLLIRPYKNLNEVREVEVLLRKARLVTDFLSEAFGLKATGTSEPSVIDLENEVVAPDTRLSSLWLTAMVHHDSGAAVGLTSLSASDAKNWVQNLLVDSNREDAVRLLEAKSKAMLDHLEAEGKALVDAMTFVVVGPSTRRLVENLFGVDPENYDMAVISDLFLIA